MRPFSWQCQNLCLLSLAFILDWRVVYHKELTNIILTSESKIVEIQFIPVFYSLDKNSVFGVLPCMTSVQGMIPFSLSTPLMAETSLEQLVSVLYSTKTTSNLVAVWNQVWLFEFKLFGAIFNAGFEPKETGTSRYNKDKCIFKKTRTIKICVRCS